MAYAAVISLKRNTYTPQLQLKPHLEWLEKILRRLDDTRNRSNRSVINALDARIRDAVWKIEDVLESYALLHHSPAQDDKYEFYYYLADHSRQPSRRLLNNVAPQISSVHEESVKQEIRPFLQTIKRLGEEYSREVYKTLPADVDHDDVLPTDDVVFGGNKSTTVGLSDQCEKIRNDLLDLQSGPEVVSLVGMAGIGKTRLAREIYQHPIIVQHFDLLVWVRGGPEQQLKDVWVEIVAEVERKPKTLYLEKNIFTLVALLQKGLRGRRYLIVLDDIWSTRACGCLIRLLGAEGNGGRVLLTTRLEEVAKDVKSSIHHMLFLNNEESWNLLWQNVFGGKSFPPQLEKLGRKIAEKCEGLPLLILAVADILCGFEKMEEYWKKVADRKTTTFTDAYDMISKVLFLSYEYLQQYLKPCFLYMGVFPQSCEIPLSKLINLMIVEDFMYPKPSLTRVTRTRERVYAKQNQKSLAAVLLAPGKAHLEPNQLRDMRSPTNLSSTCRVMKAFETLYLLEPVPSLTRFITPFEKIDFLGREPRFIDTSRIFHPFKPKPSQDLEFVATSENFAMECVEKLVSNSLAIVCKNSSKFRIKSCKLHSAYWYLCVKEARKTKFFHALNKLTDGSNNDMGSHRRLSVQNNILFGIKEVYESMAAASTARSLLCTGEDHEYPVPICLNLWLLKVLDALAIRFYEFPKKVLKLVRLRYLALTHNGEVPFPARKAAVYDCSPTS